MGKKLLFYALLSLSFASCTAEKINLSPIANNLNSSYDNFSGTSTYTDRIDQINYASEITNLVSSLPKFSNDAINVEAAKLKYHLKDYIGKMEAYNLNGMAKSYSNYQKSYKKLQKLKTYLNKDEADVLNRYLVRIKTNMNTLESKVQERDSANIK
jgi:hypothetical protein